jgi:hypothetical protein
MTLFEPPFSHIRAALLVLTGAYAAVAGVRMMSAALRRGDALRLIRAIRTLILGLVAGLAALTFASGNTGFLVIGLLTLAERSTRPARSPRSSAWETAPREAGGSPLQTAHGECMLYFTPAVSHDAVTPVLRLPGLQAAARFVASVLVPTQRPVGGNYIYEPVSAPENMPDTLPAISHHLVPGVLRFPGC